MQGKQYTWEVLLLHRVTSFPSQTMSLPSRMTGHSIVFRHHTFGLQTAGNQKTQITENLARLQRAFARKWEFIFMQAEAQVKIDRKKDKTERKILDSQERAFWDVHRPVPGCVNTTEMDIRKCRRMKNPQKVKKSVYGVTEESQPQSPVHLPSQPVRKTTKEDFRKQITFLNMQIERHCLKMSKVAESLIAYTEQYVEYDPFITPAEPSNPWISDDAALWDIEMSKEPSQQRVKRWGFSMDEVLKDPVGRDQFLRFLESEFSSENLRFWLAVQDLKKRPLQDVTTRVEEIWQEFLAPGAQSAINLDSHSYEKTSQNVKDPGRYTYEDAQEHIYKLMKSDSYARFLRSNAYQDLLLAKKKPENEQGRRTSLEKFTRSMSRRSREKEQDQRQILQVDWSSKDTGQDRLCFELHQKHRDQQVVKGDSAHLLCSCETLTWSIASSSGVPRTGKISTESRGGPQS
ncbi:regulator of G-protein signaling 6 isoform X6 [Serinus canaria]|uniref:regulator of G-protein signaling 6 isoform X6 n=1 Tax=Serinus canaria TaxID=9135 RepID=UPI0021CCE2D0|nr:regulator of G-protein signaling 6 isoform X6 [Serinus canaria]XP_050831397.1 regulator of G-protein signaling 6 isoform X6 [Serinus canaria]